MKRKKITLSALILSVGIFFTACNSENKSSAENPSAEAVTEGVINLSNDLNNYYYKELFREFDKKSPEYLKWSDTLIGKPIVVELCLQSNPEASLSYLPVLDKGFNKYKFWGYFYSVNAEDDTKPCMVFKFDLDPSSKNATDVVDNFKASDYELVWDSKNKKTFNHDKRAEKMGMANELLKCEFKGIDFLTLINKDKYIDNMGISSSQLYRCLLEYDESLANDFKAGNFYTIRFGDGFINKNSEEVHEHFFNVDTKGKVNGHFLQTAKVKATIENVSVNRRGMLLFKLKDVEILELTPTTSLNYLMSLTPKPISVDVKIAEEKAKKLDESINNLNPDANFGQ